MRFGKTVAVDGSKTKEVVSLVCSVFEYYLREKRYSPLLLLVERLDDAS